MAAASNDFSGTWHSKRWFNNSKHDEREDTSEHIIVVQRSGDDFVFHSVANRGETEGSYLEGRFSVDGRVLIGNSAETASPKGEWFGMTYKHSFQLLIENDGKRLAGLWVAGTYNNGNPRISSNRWEMTRVDDAARVA